VALAERLAATIERQDGLPCGKCGRAHVGTVAELNRTKDACLCECCRALWEESVVGWFEAEHADLITIQRGRRVISGAALREATRRLEDEIASLDRAIAEPGLS
jgi:hypothetical protein